ncbi:MAG: DUF2017 family protein [Actinomycetota bacterium]
MARSRSIVERTSDGDFLLRISAEERELLRSLPRQLRELLGTGDPSLRRLSPPAHPEDARQEAEYRELVGEDLEDQRRRALEVMASTIDAERLDEEQISAWLGSLNDLRLVLGTRLDVTEEMYEEGIPEEDQRSPAFALYLYLGWLEEQIVAALSPGLPSS